jgi:hypothetical protein
MATVKSTQKTMTIDDALIRTLRVRSRLNEHKLVFFSQLRFARETKSKQPAAVAVKKALATLVAKKIIAKLESGRYELGSKAPPAPPKPKKVAREPLPPGRCFFPVEDREILTKVRAKIEKHFEVTAKTDTAISFRWRRRVGGPDFRLQLGERKEAIRRMKPTDREKMEAHVPKFTGFLVLLFDNVDEVVNESNDLIEAQLTIGKVTKGPMFNAWNRSYVESV